jgi:hypothetical protein
MFRFFWVELLTPARIWSGFGSHISTLFHLVVTKYATTLFFLLVWRIGIWGDGLELGSVDFNSSRLRPVDSESMWYSS